MVEQTCCTCASILSSSPVYLADSEKPSSQPPPRRLSCCNRNICATCIEGNTRLAKYCPFCQISTEPSVLPQGLRDPPPYSPPSNDIPAPINISSASSSSREEPPAYSTLSKHAQSTSSKDDNPAPDVLHYLRQTDTLASISLAYNVPKQVLRRHNNLFSDNLLSARKTIWIPGSHYKGAVSLSADPPDGEEEEERKSRIRKFMVATKCHKYEEAELYLKQAGNDVDTAIRKWHDDEKWERENPYNGHGKGKFGELAKRKRMDWLLG